MNHWPSNVFFTGYDPHFAFNSASVLERCCQVRGVLMILQDSQLIIKEIAVEKRQLTCRFQVHWFFLFLHVFYLWLYLSTHVCLVTCFLNLVLCWDNQDLWNELSEEVVSKLSRSVVSIALSNGDYSVVPFFFQNICVQIISCEWYKLWSCRTTCAVCILWHSYRTPV